MSLDSLNKNLQSIEHGLNIMGYIPIVGTFSACIRFTYGKMEMITGLAVSLISFTGSIFASDLQRQQALESRAIKAIEYSLHGWLNMGRCFLEIIPFISLVTCLPYDLSGRKIIVYTSAIDGQQQIQTAF
ncbi:hypothetical protein [Candidatus Protochlamydia phocaeensis]|uniref:hypothetical protein n=1 Tax=Candidatus Protochlamydia phocaeensis TaxID=1414722 RepID=UPI00083867D5|nr:hypothetical protein [Candidatus Protochlamydia phocaeensis]